MGELVAAGSKYTDDQRRQAALLYAIKGTMSVVSQETGIPETTLSNWRQQEWWEVALVEVRSQNEDLWRARWSEIVDKATLETLDRLEKGDEVHTKDGIKTMKVRGKDAATIGAIANDKLRLSLNLPTSISDNGGGTAAMQALAEQFRKLSESYNAKQVKDARAIDGESVELGDSKEM